MAVHLQRAGQQVALIARDAVQAADLKREGENKLRLPGVSLAGLEIVPPAHAPAQCDAVMVALPSHAFASVLPALHLTASSWVSLAKGVVLETLTTPCQTLASLLPAGTQVFSLSGPTHAGSVAAGLPSAMVLVGAGEALPLQAALSHSGLMRVYSSTDLRGVELGGALKNAYAVAAGICDGLQLGDNAKAALLTRALGEMARLGTALGGQPETFFGLTGIGDLMATSYGPWSRNRQLGERVARGEDAAGVVEKGLTAEGYRASEGLWRLAQQKRVEAPILAQVFAVLHQKKAPKEALTELMTRPLKPEQTK